MFVSQTEIVPSANKCDLKFTYPKEIKIYGKERNGFGDKTENIYFSFFSYSGLYLEFTVKFENDVLRQQLSRIRAENT